MLYNTYYRKKISSILEKCTIKGSIDDLGFIKAMFKVTES